MAKDTFTRKRWGLWVQPDGPNTQVYFLGCHTVDDITESLGATTLIRCFREDGTGWDIIGSTQDPPDPITVSIETPIFETADWLEKVDCPFTIFVNGSKCGRLDLFTNWQRSFALNASTTTEKTLSGLASQEEDGPSMQGFSYEAEPPVHRLFKVVVSQQSTTETDDLNDIIFCNQIKCADECGAAADACESGIAVGDATSGSPSNVANVLETTTSGGTWTATVANPFAGGEDIISATCFYVGADTIRLLVARGAVVGEAAQVAYSDDWGATWTTVTVGATLGQGANYGGALFSIDRFHIWLVTDGGYVYFSEDGAETWSTQDAGLATAQDLNAIWGEDESNLMAVGDSDAVIVTFDGGVGWTAATATGGGGNLLCVGLNPTGTGIWWVGDNGGRLYFSSDDGTTWTQRTGWVGSGSGTITDVQFYNDLCGFMLHNTAVPVGTILRTIDGGYTWDALSTPSNTGLNALWVCGCNEVFAVGNGGVILHGFGT